MEEQCYKYERAVLKILYSGKKATYLEDQCFKNVELCYKYGGAVLQILRRSTENMGEKCYKYVRAEFKLLRRSSTNMKEQCHLNGGSLLQILGSSTIQI